MQLELAAQTADSNSTSGSLDFGSRVPSVSTCARRLLAANSLVGASASLVEMEDLSM